MQIDYTVIITFKNINVNQIRLIFDIFCKRKDLKTEAFRSYLHLKLASFVVISAKKVHSLAKLMYINERTYCDKGAEDAPAPIRACAKAIADTASVKLIADSLGQSVIPYERSDSKSKI